MARTGGAAPGRWGTAVALFAAVLLLSVLHGVPLVLLPLLVLWVGLTRGALRRAAGVLVLLAAVYLLPDDPVAALSRGWAMLIGGALLVASVLRPRWPVFPRALAAVAAAGALSGLWLLATGGWEVLDGVIRGYFHAATAQTFGAVGAQLSDVPWAEGLYDAMQSAAELKWRIFPALLALQSLAALALAAWWLPRLRRRGGRSFALGRLREFRFNDQLIWVLIAGLVLVLLSPGAGVERAGENAVVFMSGLYALRGLGVLFFLAGAPSVFAVVFGALAMIFLYPLVLATMLVVGVGDTWLDVRGRAAVAPRA